MAALPVRTLVDAGTRPTLVAASVSDTAKIGNGKANFAVYKNGSGSTVTLTVLGQGTTEYGKDLPDNVISVAAGAEVWIPLRSDYSDGTGSATITLNDATTVTAAVVTVG